MKYLILIAIILGSHPNVFAGKDSTNSDCIDTTSKSRPIKIKRQTSTSRDSITIDQTQSQAVSILCCDKPEKKDNDNNDINIIDILTVILSIIDKIIWPLFIFMIVWPLRDSIKKRLESIKRAKYGKLEFEFRNELDDAAVTAPNLFGVPMSSDLSKSILDKTSEIIKVSPRAAIMEAWAELEQGIRKIGKSYDISAANIVDILKELNLKQFIDSDERGAINNLRQLRNKATHAYLDDLSTETATEFCLLAIKLSEALKNRAKQWNANEK